jgi:hypothetical protein
MTLIRTGVAEHQRFLNLTRFSGGQKLSYNYIYAIFLIEKIKFVTVSVKEVVINHYYYLKIIIYFFIVNKIYTIQQKR